MADPSIDQHNTRHDSIQACTAIPTTPQWHKDRTLTKSDEQNLVYSRETIRIAKPGKAELTSGLGRAGFAIHGPPDALATSKFGPSNT